MLRWSFEDAAPQGRLVDDLVRPAAVGLADRLEGLVLAVIEAAHVAFTWRFMLDWEAAHPPGFPGAGPCGALRQALRQGKSQRPLSAGD